MCILVSLCVYYYVYVYITISMCILPSIVTIATARSNIFYEPKAGKGQRVDMSIYANNVFYLSQTPLTSLALTYSQRANCVERSQSNKSTKTHLRNSKNKLAETGFQSTKFLKPLINKLFYISHHIYNLIWKITTYTIKK